MRNGGGKLDVTHTLTAYLLRRDLDAALLTDPAHEALSLIFAAHTLPVLCRAKDSLTEQAVSFCLQRAVVDGLGLRDLTERPAADHFGGSETYLNGIKNILIHIAFYASLPCFRAGVSLLNIFC